jgi:predicted ATPase
MARELPSGTVTFLFTDVEGSTRLLQELGAERYGVALENHRLILRKAFAAHGGVEVDTQGDAFFVVFPEAAAAVEAAINAQRALESGPLTVRMGLHTGAAHLAGERSYVGEDVHLGARIAAAGHGGQVVVSAATRALIDGQVTDLGEHRLKDFAEPVAMFQLGSEEFPPLKTISNTNLPRPASPFVGRELEVSEIGSLLRDRTRLLTLTGPGGSGKTRLAIEAAADLVSECKAGVFWVGLAAVRDSSLVVETIAQTLGAKDGLAEHIGERELLLLLDNLEQVVGAAPELAELVESCRNLRLLITSRELLRVRGEVEYPVLPLAEPEAVELFCTRARVEPDETVAELCSRLDNLPLALELAAARTAVLSPGQILDRLGQRLDLFRGGRDAHPRQETLRATIAWSHDLLDEDEGRLFARLAVFRGGCTLDSAESVAEAELNLLQSLTEKNLLRHTGERFWMLETIREYAYERLDRSIEGPELLRRHAEHYMALAEEAYPLLQQSPKWLDRLDEEHDNLRAALDRFQDEGETQLALRMGGMLARFWFLRGHLNEAQRRLESVLGADSSPTTDRALALNGAANIALMRGQVELIGPLAEEALALDRRFGDARGACLSTYLLGQAAANVRDWRTAQQYFEEGLQTSRELGDEEFTLGMIDMLALACHKLGEQDRALALAEENLRRARATENERIEATALGALALYLVDDGRIDDAVPLLIESCRLWQRLRSDFDELSLNLCTFARAVALAGNARAAAGILALATSLLDDIGAAAMSYLEDLNEETLAIIRSELGEAEFPEAWEEGRNLTVDDAVALALESLIRR